MALLGKSTPALDSALHDRLLGLRRQVYNSCPIDACMCLGFYTGRNSADEQNLHDLAHILVQ